METFIFFLWGSRDRSDWGGGDSVLISDFTIKLIANHDIRGWGIVAHELGHAWGLPHLAVDNKLAIMRVDSSGWAQAAEFFPFAILTDGEKKVVIHNLKNAFLAGFIQKGEK